MHQCIFQSGKSLAEVFAELSVDTVQLPAMVDLK